MSQTAPTPKQSVTLENQKSNRLNSYATLFKFRLSFIVVLSSFLGYWMAAPVIDWTVAGWLTLGGFLVTGASNSFNQIIERKLDKLMKRTQNRPLPTEKISLTEAYAIAFIAGVSGLFVLWCFINTYSAILAAIALLSYVLVYTPLKQKTPLAVFVGAFPGAVPPMLGWIAYSNDFTYEPGILFAIQFMWQFPHFWAIAWVADEDYKKAGFRLLPSKGGKNKESAFQILLYSLFLVPASMLPWVFDISGNISMIIAVIVGVAFVYQSYRLYQKCEVKEAKILMFASFIYLPLLQLAYVLNKIG